MISQQNPLPTGLRSFRVKLMLAMMLLVSIITAVGLYYAQRNLAANVERDLQREFQSGLTGLHDIQELRHKTLAELCRVLVRKPRIHAALEDNALDLLYPTAKDELRDLMKSEYKPAPAGTTLQAEFYRFLDHKGLVISPVNLLEVGELRKEEETQLELKGLPREPQIGYLSRTTSDGRNTITEIMAMTITSTDTGEPIAALVIGFKPVAGRRGEKMIRRGIWLERRLYFSSLSESEQSLLANQVSQAVAVPDRVDSNFSVQVEGVPHLLFYKRLNPGSLFPPAYEVCIYPLTELHVQQRQLRWQIFGAGTLLLFVALTASHFISVRLSRPVEKLAVDSEENRSQRQRAEAALELTNEGLQRAIRFSADASHQLKTPVTVLRAGLEELLARDNLELEVREEISELVHQTYRLAGVIEDLLLLSRADAGRLPIQFTPVNLTQLIEAWLDDLGALPDGLHLRVETDLSPALYIAGEKRYTTMIVQNLLENARKYNRAEGRIRVTAHSKDGWIFLSIGNTGRPIPPDLQEHIFERFHRGLVGENIPGYGLGLNLARELARIHGGDLRLTRSDELWTEFEVRFQPAAPPPNSFVAVA